MREDKIRICVFVCVYQLGLSLNSQTFFGVCMKESGNREFGAFYPQLRQTHDCTCLKSYLSDENQQNESIAASSHYLACDESIVTSSIPDSGDRSHQRGFTQL
jgi:hypothetical protein